MCCMYIAGRRGPEYPPMIHGSLFGGESYPLRRVAISRAGMSITGCEPACDPFTYCSRTVSLVGSEANCDPTARLPGSRCYPSGREHRAIWGAGLLARTSAPWEGRLNGKDKPKKHDDDIGVIVLPRPGTACDRPRYCENDTVCVIPGS
jgi:hypothetical protein